MKKYISILISCLLFPFLGAQHNETVTARRRASSGPVPPVRTYRYATYNSANTWGTTGGASSCVSPGDVAYSAADLADSNLIDQTNTTYQPTCVLSAVNGLPAWAFSSQQFTAVTDNLLPSSYTSVSAFAVLKLSSTGILNVIVGPYAPAGFIWYINSSNQQVLGSAGTGTIATSTGTPYSSGSFIAIFFTLDTTSGNFTMGHCSAGSDVSDGSGTATSQIVTIGAIYLGWDQPDNIYFSGDIAEFGPYLGASNSGVCAWVQSKYGI